jgi:hypothetical protein
VGEGGDGGGGGGVTAGGGGWGGAGCGGRGGRWRGEEVGGVEAGACVGVCIVRVVASVDGGRRSHRTKARPTPVDGGRSRKTNERPMYVSTCLPSLPLIPFPLRPLPFTRAYTRETPQSPASQAHSGVLQRWSQTLSPTHAFGQPDFYCVCVCVCFGWEELYVCIGVGLGGGIGAMT